MFHAAVSTWLERRFGRASPAQEAAWPLIAAGRDVLVTAPTGSGKTLAAFLACLDRLVRASIEGTLTDRTQVLYVSPLKALSNDIRRNLEQPLAEIAEVAAELGFPRPLIRTAVRTGDTPADERRATTKRPPHVWVTTPESLYILLTSESGRRALAGVRTLVIDEIHAMAADKRGAHLALSVERLDHLVAADAGSPDVLQRIGLSATVEPLSVAARLLVGSARPEPARVEVARRRDADLAIELPKDEIGAVCTHEQWGEIYDRLTTLAKEHRSTLVFVNTRRLVERVTHQLGLRLGEDVVAAHHGSMSRDKRHDAELKLKEGKLRLVVATASLELGIDVGAVDLVCLVGSPRAIATGMQRIGRSGHMLGGTPKGRLFPLTRDQLLECAALVQGIRTGVMDRIAMRQAPLDILSQQIVAACACESWNEDELFGLCRKAAPYASLDRKDFDAVVDMLSEGIATSRGRNGALLHRDGVNGTLRGRRGARLAALTSGGAIPDMALYEVVQDPEGTVVGTLDEDFAIESQAGDIFLLGNTSWRIRRVETGRVRVENAHGAPPTVPFWFGEGPARTAELSREVARVRLRAIGELPEGALGHHDGTPSGTSTLAAGAAGISVEAPDWALEPSGRAFLEAYVRAGAAALGGVPTQERLIVERFFDESGGMQVVLHAPFGGRINRAWGMALRKRFCRSFDFELQAAATDDGVLLSIGPQHSFPLSLIFELVRPEDLEEVLTQAVLQSPMFETRWRWNAMRSLALLRSRGGKRVPPFLQRMRAQDLIAAVFPGQTACQDNHGGGAIEVPDHPLVKETLRDCLHEPLDVDGLRQVITDLRAGRIQTLTVDLPEPSVFAHEILNANPYAFLDDAPLEERRTRAVSLRRGLPAVVVEMHGALDESAIDGVVGEAAPTVRNADELHDLLLDAGAFPEDEGRRAGWEPWLGALVSERRATRMLLALGDASKSSRVFWVAAERLSLVRHVWPEPVFETTLCEPPARGHGSRAWAEREGALGELVRGHAATAGPFTEASCAARLALSHSDVAVALAGLEAQGAVLRGRFDVRLTDHAQWCDRRLLARIHRRTLEGLRREIEPVSAADLMRFLLIWQHVAPGTALDGPPGLSEILHQLQGCEIATGTWEKKILAARLRRYESAWLDQLCLSGQFTWGRLAERDSATAPNRSAPIALVRRADLPWLRRDEASSEDGLSTNAREVLAFLRAHGASFTDEILAGTRRLRTDAEDALWELVGAGRVTGDSFAGLRALLAATAKQGGQRQRWHARWGRQWNGGASAGRWSVLRTVGEPPTEDERLEALARQYVRRWGVVFRELLTREAASPPWRDLLPIYRRLEMRGELRGGRMVAGFVGEQFAAPEALEALRAVRRKAPSGERVELSACDPLNLTGVIFPGTRIPAVAGNTVLLRDGVPELPDATWTWALTPGSTAAAPSASGAS